MSKAERRRQIAGELQDLIGRAKAAYLNDRAPDRAERVLGSLDRAFDLALELNELLEKATVSR